MSTRMAPALTPMTRRKRAIRRAFGAAAERMPVSSQKAVFGHTLGAPAQLKLPLPCYAANAECCLQPPIFPLPALPATLIMFHCPAGSGLSKPHGSRKISPLAGTTPVWRSARRHCRKRNVSHANAGAGLHYRHWRHHARQPSPGCLKPHGSRQHPLHLDIKPLRPSPCPQIGHQ